MDTVVDALEKDPSKTFIYVEIAFFYRWWNEQNTDMRNRVAELVKEGRLEFINGGWCMNDEAGVSDEAIITQMTRGHQFLKETFGVTPTVGWQVDPFGHSNTMMSLFGQMGYSSVFFARMDYQDYDLRKNETRLQFVWRPSKSLGSESDIFTHQMWDTTYCYPSGFNFEGGDAPINDDPRLENMNMKQRASELSSNLKARISAYPSGKEHILVTYGCDFAYQNAHVNYKNMDKLMQYMNDNVDEYGFQLIYSTPSRFAKAVNEMNLTFTLKTDDIFPYADRPYAYWTGYFTSRPALKGYVRSRNAVLRAADKMIAVFANDTSLLSSQLSDVDVLRRAFSVSQHHDAVAGTEKQHVADDYAKLLHNGTVAVQNTLQNVLSSMTGLKNFQFCAYVNQSICVPVTDTLKSGKMVPLVFYNSLGWNRTMPITVPAIEGATVHNTASQGWHNPFNGNYEITFLAEVPALGFATYYVVPPDGSSFHGEKEMPEPVASISNQYYTIRFDGEGGSLSSINNMDFRMDYLWYNESAGNNKNSTQADGAYIFRPNSTTPFPVLAKGKGLGLTIGVGPVFSAASMTYGSWVQSIVKLYNGLDFVEIVSKVGPIDISDGMGKEVIHRYTTTAVNNGDTWYTDSSWEEMQKRVYNHRDTWNLNVTNPVSGNYYPMNSMAFLKDNKTQLTVMSDRSRGCASLQNGEFESMLHRRLLFDDQRGVGEPLNETEAIITVERLSLKAPNPIFRQDALELNHPFQMAVASGVSSIDLRLPVSGKGLKQNLPSNIHLMDFYMTDADNAIVRLRHLYGKDEDQPYSNPASITLEDYFMRNIVDVVETQLTTVQPRSYVDQRMHWNVQNEQSKVQHLENPSTMRKRKFSFTFNPMQIRTFAVKFQ